MLVSSVFLPAAYIWRSHLHISIALILDCFQFIFASSLSLKVAPLTAIISFMIFLFLRYPCQILFVYPFATYFWSNFLVSMTLDLFVWNLLFFVRVPTAFYFSYSIKLQIFELSNFILFLAFLLISCYYYSNFSSLCYLNWLYFLLSTQTYPILKLYFFFFQEFQNFFHLIQLFYASFLWCLLYLI